MIALVFDIRTNSLYSIRIPFTWQSSLTYPILPPSAIIGILANALQRYKSDKHPLYYLEKIENEIIWAGSRLLSPCVIKSYTTSAIVKWEGVLGGKFTNALGRQFAYSKKLQLTAIFKTERLLSDISEALKTSPLTCGDSESPISLESDVFIRNVEEVLKEEFVETKFPFIFDKDIKIEEGNGIVYFMHLKCKKEKNLFPLTTTIVPIREERKIFYPSYLKIKIKEEKVLRINEIGDIILKG